MMRCRPEPPTELNWPLSIRLLRMAQEGAWQLCRVFAVKACKPYTDAHPRGLCKMTPTFWDDAQLHLRSSVPDAASATLSTGALGRVGWCRVLPSMVQETARHGFESRFSELNSITKCRSSRFYTLDVATQTHAIAIRKLSQWRHPQTFSPLRKGLQDQINPKV